eukprot:5677000-Prymnesium_polylepis.1
MRLRVQPDVRVAVDDASLPSVLRGLHPSAPQPLNPPTTDRKVLSISARDLWPVVTGVSREGRCLSARLFPGVRFQGWGIDGAVGE